MQIIKKNYTTEYILNCIVTRTKNVQNFSSFGWLELMVENSVAKFRSLYRNLFDASEIKTHCAVHGKSHYCLSLDLFPLGLALVLQ